MAVRIQHLRAEDREFVFDIATPDRVQSQHPIATTETCEGFDMQPLPPYEGGPVDAPRRISGLVASQSLKVLDTRFDNRLSHAVGKNTASNRRWC
jgi:hypothetical protein